MMQLLLFQRVYSALLWPILMFFSVLRFGLHSALVKQIQQPSWKLLSPWAWWKLSFEAGFGPLLAQGDKLHAIDKRRVVSQARGVVLEIGAGAGATVKYYDSSKIEKLYCVEPFKALHGQLQESIQAAGLYSKSQIVTAGIQDAAALKAGNLPSNFDTVVCVQCLCSIPNPKLLIARLDGLLKPGGRLIIFEHVASTDPLSRICQNLWTLFFWRALFGGCELNRPSGDWIKASTRWKSIQLTPAHDDTAASLLPHAVGIFVKA